MGWDFRAYYAATHALVAGGNLYDLGLPNTPFYLYPPLLAFLLLPVGLAFPLSSAGTIWLIGQHFCLLLLGVGVLAVTWVPGGRWPLSLRAGLLLFLWGTGVPLRDEIYLGQVNSGVWLLLLAGLILAQPWRPDVERGGGPRLLTTALVLGLAISIKVQPVVLLPYFVLRRRPRLAIATTVAFLLFQVLTIPFTASTLDYWFHLFPDLLGRAQGYVDNQSINGLAARWLLPGVPDLPSADNNPAAWRLLNLSGNLLVWGAVLAVFAVPIIIALPSGARAPVAAQPGALAALYAARNLTAAADGQHHLVSHLAAPPDLVGAAGAGLARLVDLARACTGGGGAGPRPDRARLQPVAQRLGAPGRCAAGAVVGHHPERDAPLCVRPALALAGGDVAAGGHGAGQTQNLRSWRSSVRLTVAARDVLCYNGAPPRLWIRSCPWVL